MKRFFTSVPALVISAGALLVALTGFATAGTTAGVTPAQVRAIAKTVANTQITARASSLSVATAKNAAAPAVYAQVTSAGEVTGNAKGISGANVIHPGIRPGIYCLRGLPSAPKGGVVTVDANGSGPETAQLGLTAFRDCPSDTQAFVATFNPGESLASDPFFVVLWF